MSSQLETPIAPSASAPSAEEPFHEVTEGDYAALYEEQRAENERLRAVIAAAKIKPVTVHPAKDAKPGMTNEKLRSQIGANAYRNLSRADKVAALGVDPSTVDEAFLRKCFGKSNSGIEARELMNSNPLRYRQLKECAKALDIFSN